MLTIWCNMQFSGRAQELLNEGTRGHRLVFPETRTRSSLAAAGKDEVLAAADIAFGQPDAELVMQTPGIRWVHLTSAGYTRYDTPEFRAAAKGRGLPLTNSSSVYAEPCAEHVFAFMVAHARRLDIARDVQLGDRSWPTAPIREKSRLLTGQSAVILGFGAIARRLVELLAPFSMRISVLRRSASGSEGVPVITPGELPHVLAEADHVFNILPDNAGTRGFMTAALFDAMKPGAVFYNIGRGTTIDQGALLARLQSGRVAAAWLDVTDPEPLPPEHALWKAPNCFITPHTAGGHDTEFERLALHFLGNFERFVAGRELNDRVM
ncbi:MAG TPA: D-2-hydroxyacid dehydrogenase [Chthoniobacteraceae bacterium]|nr:D-2-hydroxyacid dehydrogenase [Chthoniobacteraceae bacterium]